MDLEKALEFLCCPKCKADLEFYSNDQRYFCQACKVDYPVIDGIPRFIEVNDALLSEAKQHWEASPHFQYEAENDLYSKEYYEEQDRWRVKEIDPYSISNYKFNEVKGKVTLDIGCGSGWVVKQAAKHGAFSIGVDFTEKAAFSTKKALETYGLNGLAIQADAQYLPIKSNTIDRVFSIGVLHHIPDTEKGIAEAYRIIKPNGTAFISLYGKLFFFNPVLFPVAQFVLRRTVKAPKVRDGIQYCRDYDDFYKHMDGPTNPIGRWYNSSEFGRLFSQFQIVSHNQSHFPLRYIKLFGKPLSQFLPDSFCHFLDACFGMMRNYQLKKEG